MKVQAEIFDFNVSYLGINAVNIRFAQNYWPNVDCLVMHQFLSPCFWDLLLTFGCSFKVSVPKHPDTVWVGGLNNEQ